METGHYLRCDRDGCDHQETVPGITEDMIGKACPNCGDSLLTKADYEHWANVVEPQLAALRVIEAEAIKQGIVGADDAKIIFDINHHNGASTVKVDPLEGVEQ
ncbi:hypothetical protein [Paremcibacter congregatus]|uniref:hypothetical protein n=1 Tax=Paremcibacter congregatus TaxID=2043170 RepID=UPI003A936633